MDHLRFDFCLDCWYFSLPPKVCSAVACVWFDSEIGGISLPLQSWLKIVFTVPTLNAKLSTCHCFIDLGMSVWMSIWCYNMISDEKVMDSLSLGIFSGGASWHYWWVVIEDMRCLEGVVVGLWGVLSLQVSRVLHFIRFVEILVGFFSLLFLIFEEREFNQWKRRQRNWIYFLSIVWNWEKF